MQKPKSDSILVSKYGGHRIDVQISASTAMERVFVDGLKVSQRMNCIGLDHFHHFTLVSGQKGYVQIKTYILDCVVAIKVVVDERIIDKCFWKMPMPLSFRELMLWFPLLGLLVWGSVKVQLGLGFRLPKWGSTVSVYIFVVIAIYLAKRVSTWFTQDAVTRMNKEINEIPMLKSGDKVQ